MFFSSPATARLYRVVNRAVGSNGIGGEIARAYTHGFAQGAISHFTGGDFMSGFSAGGLGSLGGSAFSAIAGDGAKTLLGQVGFSSLSGGIGAEFTGGDFWRGAATGATIGLLNHCHDRGLTKKAQSQGGESADYLLAKLYWHNQFGGVSDYNINGIYNGF